MICVVSSNFKPTSKQTKYKSTKKHFISREKKETKKREKKLKILQQLVKGQDKGERNEKRARK